MIEHPKPTQATIKYLYAHAFVCGFKGCRRTLYRLDERTGVRTLNSRICHINARSEGGPRWNPNQSASDNRSRDNLILMCIEHASAIDDPSTQATYRAEILRQWKAEQLAHFDKIRQGWALDQAMTEEVRKASFSNVDVAIVNSQINLGGGGGNAPGAGGGGGGAIGKHARAGRGGDGGGRRIHEGPLSTAGANLPNLDRLPMVDGQPPGAGGGGAGAIGDGAIAGDGGGGGEHVTAVIDGEAFRKVGGHQIRVRVGKAGKGAYLPGQHGEDGEDSVAEIIDAKGSVIDEIRVIGGRGALSPGARLPDGVRELSVEDIRGGFRLTSVLVANSCELRDDLFYVLGGDWAQYPVATLPIDAVFPILISMRWTTLAGSLPIGLFISLLDPNSREIACQNIIIPPNMFASGTCKWIGTIGANLKLQGSCSLHVRSGDYILATTDFKVIVPK